MKSEEEIRMVLESALDQLQKKPDSRAVLVTAVALSWAINDQENLPGPVLRKMAKELDFISKAAEKRINKFKEETGSSCPCSKN